MKANSAMRQALGKMRLGTELNPSLKSIARGGFEQCERLSRVIL